MDADANADARGSTIALCELRSGELKSKYHEQFSYEDQISSQQIANLQVNDLEVIQTLGLGPRGHHLEPIGWCWTEQCWNETCKMTVSPIEQVIENH